MSLNSHAVVLTGRIWIGAVGADSRREYMLIGEPVQLAAQMLELASNENPVLVDAVTSQANISKYNFAALPTSVRVPGRLKLHTVLAIKEPRPIETVHKGQKIPYDIQQWLRSHKKLRGASTSNMAKGISDSALQQLRESFKELDADGSGAVSHAELLEAIREIDAEEAGTPGSMRDSVEKMIKAIDQDGDGEISFDEFLALAAASAAGEGGEESTKGPQANTQNLPLLLSARTTRKRLQHELGDGFTQLYFKGRKASNAAALANRRKSQVQRNAAVLVGGDDVIGFTAFCELVKVAEPAQEYSDAELRQLFDSFDVHGEGTVNRRDYMRTILFQRLRKSAGRTIELFLRLDSERCGHVDQKQFANGMRGLGFTHDEGFTDEDISVLFTALDADNSRTIEYNELALSLTLTGSVQTILAQLRPAPRRGSIMVPDRRLSLARRKSHRGSISPRVMSIGEWRREDRKQSVRDVLNIADAEADAKHRRQSVAVALPAGSKPQAIIQNMSDEVDRIYAEYKAMRNKAKPAGSDRTAASSDHGSPRGLTPGGVDKTPSIIVQPSGSPHVDKLSAAYIAGGHHAYPSGSQSARLPQAETPASSPRTASRLDVKSLASNPLDSLNATPRGLFPGPGMTPTEPSPHVITVDDGPPSSKLPTLKRGAAAPESMQYRRRPSVVRRWAVGSGQEEVAENRMVRRGLSRDHQEHIAPSLREATTWQRELRYEQRERLFESQTAAKARAQQQARLQAFQCLRDMTHELPKELELGQYGSTGLAMGSPPRTPTDETAMRNWVGPPALSSTDMEELSRANEAEVRESNVESLNPEEQRKWLHEPLERGSFAPIVDILERHGVTEQFRLAGAPGLGIAEDREGDEAAGIDASFASLDAALGDDDGSHGDSPSIASPAGVRAPPTRDSDSSEPGQSSASRGRPSLLRSGSPSRLQHSSMKTSTPTPPQDPRQSYARQPRVSFASWTNLKKK